MNPIAKLVNRAPWCALLCLLSLSITGCATQLQVVPLPQLESPLTLRVVHATNPRFPAMTPEQRAALFAAAQRTARAHFGVDVQFDDRGDITLPTLFALLPPPRAAQQRAYIYDFKNGQGDRTRLVRMTEEALRGNPAPLADLIAYARPHLTAPLTADSYPALAEALTATLLGRLRQWRELQAADGRPVLDDSDYNEWALWDALGYGELPYDIVITNQLIASAEYPNQDVHTAVRGGITVGTTSYSRRGRYGAFVFFTVYPFLADHPELERLRRGERYAPQEAARLAGAYLSHELGHLLFHFGHPYDRPACAMRPAELLAFRAWAAALDPAACPIDCCPAMRPGAARIEYQAN